MSSFKCVELCLQHSLDPQDVVNIDQVNVFRRRGVTIG